MKITSDHVIGALIGLARACISNGKGPCTDTLVLSALSCPPDASEAELQKQIEHIDAEKAHVSPGCLTSTARCGNTDPYDLSRLWSAPEEIRTPKSLLLAALRMLALYSTQKQDPAVNDFLYRGLYTLAEDWSADELRPYVLEAGALIVSARTLMP